MELEMSLDESMGLRMSSHGLGAALQAFVRTR
jgi:hypothetical protein